MDDIDRQLAYLHAEIDNLKILIWGTADEAERRHLGACLFQCFQESIQLVEQRIQSSASVQGDVLRERSAGQSLE
jgi:hypothetical protein